MDALVPVLGPRAQSGQEGWALMLTGIIIGAMTALLVVGWASDE